MSEVTSMAWVYYGKLFDSKFQAGCLAARIRDDWWIQQYRAPRFVGIFQTKSGRYGVKCLW
ncbi:hypothetical protein [Effusibacillus pohliae]|uniref:hypothetical protein n=1 Tax=Effusibacillus pohliae TaxID=232270 RepID=UPI0012EAF8D7|nr:hypothetical protein [Effusibacillus pohliae]